MSRKVNVRFERERGKFKNSRYLISNIMANKKLLSGAIIIYIILILLAFSAMNFITYQREVAVITINESRIQEVKFGFQTITISQGFFNSIPEGNLRLNYELKDKKLNEVFSVGTYENLGNGSIVMVLNQFPLNNTWEARFELKNENLTSISKFCTIIKIEVENGSKKVTQENCI